MRQSDSTKGTHPAVEHVKNYLSGGEHCVVMWGLSDSLTAICAKNIADGIIKEGYLAKTFHCDQIASEELRSFVLSKLGCKSLNDFVKHLPTHGYSWLIFNAVDDVFTPTPRQFFQDLIQLSRNSGTKFKILIFTNQVTTAISILQWANEYQRITLVEPVGCCRWREEHLLLTTVPNMELSIRAGCPRVFSRGESDELAARWELNIGRLQDFLMANK